MFGSPRPGIPHGRPRVGDCQLDYGRVAALPTRGQIIHPAAMPEQQLSDRVLQRRYRATCSGLEKAGADEDSARLAASITMHFEQQHRIKVEQHETLALVAVLNLISRNLAARAGR